jgi:hypothetical protein
LRADLQVGFFSRKLLRGNSRFIPRRFLIFRWKSMQLPRPEWCSTLLLAVLLTGCGGTGAEGDAGHQKVYKVKGKITLSGAPVANANVSFSPKAQHPAAIGKTGAGGEFVLTTYDPGDGAAAGDYVVLVTKDLPPASAATAPPSGHRQGQKESLNYGNMHAQPGGEAPAATSALPEKYSRTDKSDLTATVKADGSNEFNFDLKP